MRHIIGVGHQAIGGRIASRREALVDGVDRYRSIGAWNGCQIHGIDAERTVGVVERCPVYSRPDQKKSEYVIERGAGVARVLLRRKDVVKLHAVSAGKKVKLNGGAVVLA